MAPLRIGLQRSETLREFARRIWSHAGLAAQLLEALPVSMVVLERSLVYGTKRIRFGDNVLLYPDLHLETQEQATFDVGTTSCSRAAFTLWRWPGSRSAADR